MPRTAQVDAFFRDPVFQAFATQRPVAVMAQMTLRHLLDEEALNEVFREHAQSQREDIIPFPALTQMLASVVLGQEKSVNAAMKKMQAQLGASAQAVYGKLQRVESTTARGLVRYAYARVEAARQAFGIRPRGDLAGYQTRILDGNHLAATEHRLKETRHSTAAPLPGKTLVIYDPRLDAIVEAVPIEDGYAQERSGLDEVLQTVRPRQLWVADRNFCTLKFLHGLADAGAAFVIRQHAQLVGEPVGEPQWVGSTESAAMLEQPFVVPGHEGGPPGEVRRVIVRLKRPTRDGMRELHLLTNLPAHEADALAIAQLYRQRWRIETVMQHLTMSLNCEIRSLCYPKAALFAFALALVMYNALAIIRMAADAAHGGSTSRSLSHFYLAMEIAQTTDGMLIACPSSRWSVLADLAADDFAAELLRIARGMDLSYYVKSVRGPKQPRAKPKHRRSTVHVSTKRLLDKRKQ